MSTDNHFTEKVKLRRKKGKWLWQW